MVEKDKEDITPHRPDDVLDDVLDDVAGGVDIHNTYNTQENIEDLPPDINIPVKEAKAKLSSEVKEGAMELGGLLHRGFRILSSFLGSGKTRAISGTKSRVEPNLYASLSKQYETMQSGAEAGLKEGLTSSSRFVFGSDQIPQPPQKLKIAGLRTKIMGLLSFARAYDADKPARKTAAISMNAKEMASKLKKATSALSSGILASIYMGADGVAKHVKETMEKLNDVNLAAQVKTFETSRKILSRREVKWAGYGIVLGGLGLMGLSAIHPENIAKSLMALANHSNDGLLHQTGSDVASAISGGAASLGGTAQSIHTNDAVGEIAKLAAKYVAESSHQIAQLPETRHMVHNISYENFGNNSGILSATPAPNYGVDKLINPTAPSYGVDTLINQAGGASPPSGAIHHGAHHHHHLQQALNTQSAAAAGAPPSDTGAADKLMDAELQQINAGQGQPPSPPPISLAPAAPPAPPPPPSIESAPTLINHRGVTLTSPGIPAPHMVAAPASPAAAPAKTVSDISQIWPGVTNEPSAVPHHMPHHVPRPVAEHTPEHAQLAWDNLKNHLENPWDVAENIVNRGRGGGWDDIINQINNPLSNGVGDTLNNLASSDWLNIVNMVPTKTSIGDSDIWFNLAKNPNINPITRDIAKMAAQLAAAPPAVINDASLANICATTMRECGPSFSA